MRLDAMRDAAAELMTRKRLGRDVFAARHARGHQDHPRDAQLHGDVYDLLKAYADQRRRTIKVGHVVKARTVWSLKEAREGLERLLGDVASRDWVAARSLPRQFLVEPEVGKTALASSFGATLEMAREGRVEIRQAKPFAPSTEVAPARCRVAAYRLAKEQVTSPEQ